MGPLMDLYRIITAMEMDQQEWQEQMDMPTDILMDILMVSTTIPKAMV